MATATADPNAGRMSVGGQLLSSYAANSPAPSNPNAGRLDISGKLLSTGQSPSTTVTGPTSTSTPTVISDNNIRNNVIPGIKADAAKALPNQTDPYAFKQGETVDAYKARITQMFPQTQSGTTGATSGATTLGSTLTDPNSDSSIYDKLYSDAFGATPKNDSPYDADMNLLQSMQSSSDATTSNTLASIAAQYAQKRNDLSANQQTGDQQANALLNRTGANRSGSGSQLISAEGRGYIREAANLDLQEQQATNAALAAQSDNNFKLLGQQLSVLKDARSEKLAVVNKLYDSMVAEKKQTQQDIQSVVSDAAKNGAPPDVLNSISSATDANAATQAAGAYLQTATGQLGDYVQYKKDTVQKGLTPTDYSSWKAQDDTRQAKQKGSEAYSTAYGTAAGKAAGEAASGGNTSSNVTVTDDNGKQISVPLDVAPYVGTSSNGINYVDASTLQGTAAEKKQIIDEAQKAGLKVVTNKNSVLDLTNIKDANSKLDTATTLLTDITQPDALARDLGGYGLTQLGVLAQTNPQAAIAQSMPIIGLDVLKAISGVQGFRGNQTAIQQVQDHLPKPTDTAEIAAGKVEFIRKLLDDRENAIVGKPADDPQTQVSNFVSSPDAKTAITPDINTKISSLTGGKTFDTAGQLAIYMSGLPGATPESVANVLTSLGYLK